MLEDIVELHKEVTKHLLQRNSSYQKQADSHRYRKEFKEGDIVMIHLRKGRFPACSFHKLKPCKMGPLRN